MSEAPKGPGFEFKDKVIAVTGGAHGIGEAICHEAASKGVKVAICDIRKEDADAVAKTLTDKGVEARAYGVDVASYEAVEALAQQIQSDFGAVHGVFNNAGIGAGGVDLIDTDVSYMRWVFEVNLFGVLYGIKAFGQIFKAQGGASLICNTGSEHSVGVPHTGNASYTGTKHAVLGISDVLRREAPEGMQVSVLMPGLTATNIYASGEIRPEEYGGKTEANPLAQTVMGKGFPPSRTAETVVKGIEDGSFFIPTHAWNRRYIAERSAEMKEAYDTYAPEYEGQDNQDVTKVIHEVLASL